jgi:hypothetical protein
VTKKASGETDESDKKTVAAAAAAAALGTDENESACVLKEQRARAFFS